MEEGNDETFESNRRLIHRRRLLLNSQQQSRLSNR
jgi:hypothetical protein